MSAWKVTLEKEIKDLNDRVRDLTADLEKKREQLQLLQRLVDSEKRTTTSLTDSGPKNVVNDGLKSSEVKDRVYQILRDHNRPMNIKEIHAEFGRRGFSIPGKGSPFNILVHMSREIRKRTGSRFYRTGKGTYALRETAKGTSA